MSQNPKYICLRKGFNGYITKNFREDELFSKSPDAPERHKQSLDSIHALQIIREYFKCATQVNSTYRTPQHNEDEGGGKKSRHLISEAIDFEFIGNNSKECHEQYQKDIENKEGVYLLIKKFIRGFGLYNGFNHIDSREKFAFWDKRS